MSSCKILASKEWKAKHNNKPKQAQTTTVKET